MAKGSKKSYTPKQKRTALNIEEGYKKKGASPKKAKQIAWATVNKEYGHAGTNQVKKPGKQKSSQSRSDAAKKAWITRRRNLKTKK